MKISVFLIIMFFFCCLFCPAYAQNNETELFLVSQKAFEDGFYDVAQRYINQFLQEYPNTPKKIEAKLLLGQCFFFKGQYLKAYDVFQSLAPEATHQDAILFWLSETHLKGKDYKQAKEGYEKIINLHPSSDYAPQALYALAWISFETNDLAAAKEQFENFIRKFPTHQLAEDAQFRIGECEFNAGHYANAVSAFQKYASLFLKSPRLDQAYFYIGEANFYEQQYAEALKYYNLLGQKARSDEMHLLSQIGIAWCLFRLGDFPQAEKKMEDAKIFAENKKISTEECFIGLANLYTENKNYQNALNYYQQLIDKYPDSSRANEACLGKANLLYMSEQYPQAIDAYLNLIQKKLSASEVMDKAYLGLAWAYLKNNDFEKAIKTFSEALGQTQSKAFKISVLAQMADAYQDAKQFDNALEGYDKILQEYPDTPYTDYAQYQQGITLLKMDRPESAILSFQSLEKNFPKSRYRADAKYYLGVACLNKGEWLAAKDAIIKFIQEMPLDHDLQPEAHYILGLCYQNLKQYDEAVKNLKKAEGMSPTDTDFVQKIKISIAKNYYEKGAIPEALQEFKLVIYKYPKTKAALEALLWLGEYYAQTLNIKNAISYYEQLVNDYPKTAEAAEALWALGQVYYKQENYEKALNYFKQIKEENGPEIYAKAKLSIADTFARQFDPTTAIQTYENIIKSSPEFARSAYVKMAEIYRDDKQYAKAIAAYRNALNNKPKANDLSIANSEIQFQIGDLCEIINKNDDAVSEYLKIPYLYPKETKWVVKAYLRIARIFEDKNDLERAKSIYEKIIGCNTDEKTFAQERIDAISKILANK